MRLFIGVPVKRTTPLRTFHGELVRWKRHLKVVDPRLHHVTLHFLGEVEEEQVPRLSAAMDEVARQRAPESISLQGVGAFPTPERYSVLWIGVEPAAGFHGLHDALIMAADLKVPERPFHPHVTVARHRKGSRERNASGWVDPNRTFGTFTADRLVLIHSLLHSEGPSYQTLHMSRFKGQETSTETVQPAESAGSGSLESDSATP